MGDFSLRGRIYVPKVKRRYGYYALPILHHDRLIGRLDLAMDWRSERLNVNAVHAEPGVPLTARSGRAVAGALEELASFLGARAIQVDGPLPAEWRGALR